MDAGGDGVVRQQPRVQRGGRHVGDDGAPDPDARAALGVDGVLPDMSFGVKEPIPRWPFYALIVLAGVFTALAFLFWVEGNPGTYPRVEVWWARQRGRLARLRPMRRKRAPGAEGPPPGAPPP